jgi:hypothetical protein
VRKLTDAQRKQWDTDGYVIIEGALTPEEVALYTAEIDRIRGVPGYEPSPRRGLPIGHYDWLEHADDLDCEGRMDRRDLIPYGQPFIDLIDRPNVFDLVVDIMGPYITLSMSQAIVRASDDFPGYTHTDGGEALRRIRVTDESWPLSLKALYLLADTMEENHGNFTVFPGSHREQIPYNTTNPIAGNPAKEKMVNPYSDGARQIMARAGDCVLFQHSLWHGPARNESGHARKTLLYNYCQLFMRQYDYFGMGAIPDSCTLRQRRLLGDLGYDFQPGSYFYVPTDQVEVIGGDYVRDR